MASILLLETDVGININIATVTGTASYTADDARKVLCDVSLYGVAGNGDYVMYVTRQVSGTASATVMLPKTTMPAASGETNIGGQSGWVSLGNGDRLTAYVDGLAGDTSVTGVYTRWWADIETMDVSSSSRSLIANDVWDDGLSNNTTTGTAGFVLSSILNSVDNIAVVGAPAYEAPSSYVLSTGTQTGGTYESVDTSNGVYHIHTDSGGLLDLYYEYSLKSDEEAVGIVFKGRIISSNDSVNIQAYDWVNSIWVTVHTLAGTNLTTDTNVSSPLVGKYTGTGLNSGKVRIRFVNAVTLTTATLYVDQIIVGKTITGRSVGYQDALIWLDTNGSNTNTVAYVDGVADRPVSTLAAAYTLSSSTNLKGIRFLAGSNVTLTQSGSGWRFVGQARINLGGQSIADAVFRNAYTVSGTSTGDDATFIECGIATCTLYHAYFTDCYLKGTLTLIDNNEYFFDKCIDAVSNGTATLIFGSGTNAYLRQWSGGIQINNMQAGSECIIDGAGRVIIDPSCSGGSLTVRGHFPETTGLAAFLLAGGTYTDNARWAEDQSMNALTNGYVTVTGSVVASSVTGNVVGSVGSVAGNVAGTVQAVVDGYVTVTGTVTISSPVTVTGYVVVTGTVDANVEKWNTVDVVSNAVPAFAAGAVGGLPTVDANNYIAGIQGTKNQLDDLNDIAVGAQMDLVNAPNATAITAFTNDVFTEVIEGTTTFKTWLRRIGAVLFGKASGGGVAGSKKFRDSTDAVNRVDATTDVNGNRTSVTYDDTAT